MSIVSSAYATWQHYLQTVSLFQTRRHRNFHASKKRTRHTFRRTRRVAELLCDAQKTKGVEAVIADEYGTEWDDLLDNLATVNELGSTVNHYILNIFLSFLVTARIQKDYATVFGIKMELFILTISNRANLSKKYT